MNNFYFQLPTEVYFGKGQISHLGESIKKYGDNVLLVYGGGSIKKTGLYDTVINIFKENNIKWTELSGVEPNPKIDTVRKGAKLCKENGIQAILAVGGGSTIDCAKVTAAAAKYDGDAWDLVLNSSLIKDALPIFTVVTLSATGSEMDRGAVISNMETNDKVAAFSTLFYPKVSILDPQYTFSVPQNQTAAGVADIMSHAFEKYFTRVRTAYVQDRVGEAMIKTCIHYGPIAYNDPENYEARANLMWAACLAIDGVTWRGNEVMSTCHIIEHQLSAYYDVTHGVGLAILTPRWMRYILNEQTVYKFVEYGVNVWGIDPNKDKFEIANEAIKKTEELFKSMNIPYTLREIGIGEEKLEIMAQKGSKGLQNAFWPLDEKDVLEILKMCL
ncbi:MAG: iron-containing alcohol dehydrogenase [Eubacteriaceae bacterium]